MIPVWPNHQFFFNSLQDVEADSVLTMTDMETVKSSLQDCLAQVMLELLKGKTVQIGTWNWNTHFDLSSSESPLKKLMDRIDQVIQKKEGVLVDFSPPTRLELASSQEMEAEASLSPLTLIFLQLPLQSLPKPQVKQVADLSEGKIIGTLELYL